MRKLVTALVMILLLASGAGVGYWAATNAVLPPDVPVQSHLAPVYTVQNGTVSNSIQIPVTASWITHGTLYAGSNGTLTSVRIMAGASVQSGQVIATIDLEPVVIASGMVPMFRTMKVGVVGPDVAQLQNLLGRLGFYHRKADGRFQQATETALKSWQRVIGASPNGVADLGSLIFVAALPAPMEVIPAVGQPVSVGSEFVHVLAAVPSFQATVGASDRAQLTSGALISIAAPTGGSWNGSVGPFVALDNGQFSSDIVGKLCGADCGVLPIHSPTALVGVVVLVPVTSGPLVPSSALVLEPSGDVAVTLGNGDIRAVRVVAQADGFAVVDGVAIGTSIELPAPLSP